ncbi:hypothetical protein EV401DRAFT_2032141, partial [Pisolithus croceorrhizus]
LYGIATLLFMQAYVYYMHYSDDASTIRFLVNAWLTCGLVCHFLYYYLITNYGILTSLLYMIWFASVLVHVPRVLTLINFVIGFFVHQIYCRGSY